MTIAAPDRTKATRAWAGRALGWWLEELRGLYRDAAPWQGTGDRGAVTIEAGERYWTLRQYQRPIGQIDWQSLDPDDGRQALADLIPDAARQRPLVVEIPPERVLSKIVHFPAAARNELDRILEFEIARHFPFPASRVFFRHRVISRGSSGAGGGAAPMTVELVAVPREIVAGVCAELAAVGLHPGGIAVLATGDAAPLFLPPEAVGASSAGAQRRGLPLALAVLAFVALASWPAAQRFRIAALDDEITALRPQAEAVLRERAREQRDAERIAGVVHLRASRPPLISLLDTLTREVPDGSWLQSLSISGRDLVIEGLSPSAATIALALEHSKVFADVVFRSPITREPTSGLEHFQLGATIAETKR